MIITEKLPYHADISFVELLIKHVFIIITMITFFTLFVQVFLSSPSKSYKTPKIVNLILFYFTRYNKYRYKKVYLQKLAVGNYINKKNINNEIIKKDE